MATETRWGIVGCGSIAHSFAQGLADAKSARLLACASRSADKARAFAAEFDIPRPYGKYEDLAGDDQIDAVYIATPHTFHAENAMMCIEAGRAVLCEKPFAVNASQARQVADLARSRGVFCMEAMWTRFFPAMFELRRLLADGAIGQVRMVQADFGFRCKGDPESRLMNPDLAGGGLLDVGVYAVSLASMILGRASDATGLAQIGDTGVDTQAGMVLQHAGGALSVLACGVRTQTPQAAWVLGTDGRICIESPFWRPSKLTVFTSDGQEVLTPSGTGNGYNYQADHVARCLAAGAIQSDIMPLDETIEIVETLDRLREQWNLRYPFESHQPQ